MWGITYIYTDPLEDFGINYVFLFTSFISSWYLITGFWIPFALMTTSFIVETPEAMKQSIIDGERDRNYNKRPDDAMVYMVINTAMGGAAAVLTMLNKEGLYNWFVTYFPN